MNYENQKLFKNIHKVHASNSETKKNESETPKVGNTLAVRERSDSFLFVYVVIGRPSWLSPLKHKRFSIRTCHFNSVHQLRIIYSR